MADSVFVVDVTGDSFQPLVIEASRKQPVLVDFWASWCGPCQMQTPVMKQLSVQYGGKVVLAKVNTE